MAWAPDYCTVEELAAFRRVDDDADDAQLAHAIAAASRAVDQHCGRQFGKSDGPVVRRYTAVYDRRRRSRRWVVAIDDLSTTADMAVTVDGQPTNDYELLPVNAVADGRPYTELALERATGGEHTVEVTATWGWPDVPVVVKQATLLQASRFASRRDSPYGVAGSPDLGSELRLLARVDPDVAVSLGPYVRWWAAA